ncbi:hypothetical protein KAR91_55145 [Candidatus Pacearchaeota archaeon]|nr:hypothetical protein [Candidatus Pacearchaeota archaeon]
MRMTYLSEEHEVEEFAKRAAKHFARDEKLSTFTDKEIGSGCLFALRFGLGQDCVVVFRLDENFEPTNYQQLVRHYL